jgi:hypothetical protein
MNIRLKLHMYTKRIEELVVNRSDPKRGHDNNFLKKRFFFFLIIIIGSIEKVWLSSRNIALSLSPISYINIVSIYLDT